MSKQLQANQAAWQVFQDARKDAATSGDRDEWQRLFRLTQALDVALEKKGTANNV